MTLQDKNFLDQTHQTGLRFTRSTQKLRRDALWLTSIFAILVLYSIIDMGRFGLGMIQTPVKVVFIALLLFFLAVQAQICIIIPRFHAFRTFLLYSALAYISISWSFALSDTIIALIGLLTIISSIILIHSLNLPGPIVIHSLHNALLAIIVLSLLLTPLFGSAFFDYMQGSFRYSGISYGSLSIARTSVILALTGCTLYLYNRIGWIHLFIVLGMTIWIIHWADARQAQVAIFLLFAAVLVRKALISSVLVKFSLFSLVVFTGIITLVYIDGFDLSIFARSDGLEEVTSFNGRTAIWFAVIDLISERPFLGYGFGAGADIIEANYRTKYNWTTGSAHSVYLHAMLEFGIIGGLLIFSIFVLRIARSIRQRDFFSLVYVCIIVIFGMMERSIAGAPDYTLALLFISFPRESTHTS